MTVRVVLVDDQEMIRMGLRMVLESQPGIDIVGEASAGHVPASGSTDIAATASSGCATALPRPGVSPTPNQATWW